MINDRFKVIDGSLGSSLYADYGALWVRGHNARYTGKKLQSAVNSVEKWGNKWDFRFSVDKTQFSKKTH